jgi:hypothetical protein
VSLQALARLSKIYEERGPAYANADVTVSLQSMLRPFMLMRSLIVARVASLLATYGLKLFCFCMADLALSLACEDISELTPTAITVQVKLVSPSITGEGNTCNAICSMYGSLQGAIKLLLKHLACWI